MQRLVINTVFNGAAFGLSLLIQLATVPLVLGEWGLEGLGLLGVVRLLLPTGLVALFDGAVGLSVSRGVARCRASGRDAEMRSWIVAGMWLAFASGVAVAAALMLAGEAGVLRFLAAGGPEGLSIGDSVAWMMLLAATPMLMIGVVAQSALEGMERFPLIRSTDVAIVAGFFLAAWILARTGAGIDRLLVVFIVLQTIRSAVLALAVGVSASRRVADWKPTNGSYRQLLRDCRPLYLARLLGTGSQHLPPALIAALLGVAALGLYDAVMRIPRAVKVLSGLTSSAVLPVAVRMTTLGQEGGRTALLVRGGRLAALIALPPLAALAVFAGEVLALWLGETYRAHAVLLRLALCAVALTSLVGILSTVATSELRLVRRMNAFSAAELAFHLGALVPLLRGQGLTAAFGVMAAIALLAFTLRVSILIDLAPTSVREWSTSLARVAIGALAGSLATYLLWPAAAEAWVTAQVAVALLAAYAGGLTSAPSSLRHDVITVLTVLQHRFQSRPPTPARSPE